MVSLALFRTLSLSSFDANTLSAGVVVTASSADREALGAACDGALVSCATAGTAMRATSEIALISFFICINSCCYSIWKTTT
jgi:hypothetical protein